MILAAAILVKNPALDFAHYPLTWTLAWVFFWLGLYLAAAAWDKFRK